MRITGTVKKAEDYTSKKGNKLSMLRVIDRDTDEGVRIMTEYSRYRVGATETFTVTTNDGKSYFGHLVDDAPASAHDDIPFGHDVQPEYELRRAA